MSNSNGSLSPNSRSPMTLGDFIKTRKSKKNSSPPDMNSVKILRRPIPGNFRSPGANPRSLFSRDFPRDGQIDFSVNDIVFEKVENQFEEEMKWSENDVDFAVDQKQCSYRHCLQNDSGFKAFNSFRLNSYSSEESDINFNNEHFYLPDSQQYTENGTTYFPFERVEEDAYYGADEGYYGTTYYQGDDLYYYNEQDGQDEQQVVPEQQEARGSKNVSGIENIAETLLSLDISTGSPAPKGEKLDDTIIEKDEELNNLVLSIIDDE